MAVLSCDGCEEPGGVIGITITGDTQGVNQTKLNEIKALFEKYHPDIKIIEVRNSGTNGRVGNTIKIAKNSINDWAPEDNTEAMQMINFMYNTTNNVGQAHDNGYKLMTGKSVWFATASAKQALQNVRACQNDV